MEQETTLETDDAPVVSDTDATGTEATTQDVAKTLFEEGQSFLDRLMTPWSLYQLGIALGLIVLAWCIHRVFGPRIPVREGDGVPRWKAGINATLRSRLGWIAFVVMIWVLVFAMRQLTWPSRSYLLAVIGNLATALLIVSLATQLIKNGFLRRLVTYGAWAWVTLRILGLTTEATALLESMAIEIGDTRISLWLVLQAIVTLGVFFAAARFISVNTSEQVQRNEDISPSMRVLIIKVLQVLLYGGAFFIGLKAIGFDLSGLAILSGAIGVGLGFGLQKVVSNLVSGVIILLDKSIKPGDVISLGDTFGWINALGARYVSVVTRDGREYLIPNEDLITGQVVNWSHSNDLVRLDIHFGTAYGDDPHHVRKLAIEAAKSVDRVLSYKDPVCHIVGFGDSSVDYVLRFWITDPTGGLTNIRGNVYLALWDTFRSHNINIPFPQREVRMLDD